MDALANADGNKQETDFDDVADLLSPEDVVEVSAPNLPVTSYRMKPSLRELFPASQIKNIIQVIIYDKLQGKVYNAEEARKWTREISDEVSLAVKERIQMPRFKHVVQVTLGQQLGAGCRYIAKCCWDAEADSHASDVFTNSSIFCVCTVFGVYLY
ncbi:PREDICTED: tctex1 domain-containing protein 2-like [Rhagoletis zephyria]|uniref:tctex1 domain-containing protein 2-like n=1 Tax=Rhagoletis zephyria TaxID=28612 RepID=UPI000811A204|nr:PREDICTED: tctex1 domain-containing protein 2-like [Rhagoletis zephyria]XP_036336291.1 tctex1 domain-containing protein 2 [Rhagoletis pomonella]